MTRRLQLLHAREASMPSSRPIRLRLLALALLVGLIAPLLAVASPAEAMKVTTHSRTSVETNYAWAVRTLINSQRKAHQLAPLAMNWNLRVSARRHNMTMSRYNTMSHQLPSEKDFSRRMTVAGYKWSWAGENIAWNSAISKSGVLVLQKLMYNERPPNDGHRRNILNRNFREVGVDVYIDRPHNKIWLTTDFGRKQ